MVFNVYPICEQTAIHCLSSAHHPNCQPCGIKQELGKKIKQKTTPVYTQNRIAPTIVRSRPPVPRPPMTTSNGRMVPYGQEVLLRMVWSGFVEGVQVSVQVTSQPCVLSRGHRLDRAFQDSCCWFNRGRVDWQGRGGEKSGRDRFLHRLEGVC